MYINDKYIPIHLRTYIVDQDYHLYTAIEQATWRFIMKISQTFFKENAHDSYLNGLEKTGINIDSIPSIDEMNKKLSKIGWAAVCVRGFIHPLAFMEFQSLGILPIAADMRTLDHLTYTPAPDIVHEAAGHAPILADETYANYLKKYGNIAKNAIMSNEDFKLYDAIRELSDLKENPHSTEEQINNAGKALETAYNNLSYSSEAAHLARMYWWTAEYGLIGEIENPKIYGAGLLSSVSESFNSLSDKVKKIPFDEKNIKYSYDITEQQPQLFVTPSFKELNDLVDYFAEKMAFTRGGKEGLDKAKRAKTVCGFEMNSGLQISGVLSHYLSNSKGQPVYLQLSGPTQLAYGKKQLAGHGGDYHKEGYGTVLDCLKGFDISISEMSQSQLEKNNIKKLQTVSLEFDSGIKVEGNIQNLLFKEEKLVLISFQDCRVTFADQCLFDPEWGTYDMACDRKVLSVFGRPADMENYFQFMDFEPKTSLLEHKQKHSEKKLALMNLHRKVRDVREKKAGKVLLDEVVETLRGNFTDNWLIRIELLELLNPEEHKELYYSVKESLEARVDESDLGQTIKRGLEIFAPA